MKKLALSGKYGRGQYTLVDDDDYDDLVRTKWSITFGEDKERQYVAGWRNGKHVRLHRHITKAPRNLYVDHINRNTLDNQKKNLRYCTNSQNQYNSRDTLGRHLPKGVYKSHNLSNPYKAIIMNRRKSIHIGYFKTVEEADKAYREKLQEIAGEFANA